MNAAALKYYVMASMLIFLGIALFRDLFALIVGRDFREGIFILPVVLGANVLTGVWLNLSFWYKREEKTSLAIVVTGAGLVAMMAFGFWFIPLWGYYGGCLGPAGERVGDGGGELVAQPPVLPDALRLAAHRRVCGRGACGLCGLRSSNGLRRQ